MDDATRCRPGRAATKDAARAAGGRLGQRTAPPSSFPSISPAIRTSRRTARDFAPRSSDLNRGRTWAAPTGTLAAARQRAEQLRDFDKTATTLTCGSSRRLHALVDGLGGAPPGREIARAISVGLPDRDSTNVSAFAAAVNERGGSGVCDLGDRLAARRRRGEGQIFRADSGHPPRGGPVLGALLRHRSWRLRTPLPRPDRTTFANGLANRRVSRGRLRRRPGLRRRGHERHAGRRRPDLERYRRLLPPRVSEAPAGVPYR